MHSWASAMHVHLLDQLSCLRHPTECSLSTLANVNVVSLVVTPATASVARPGP